MSLVNQVIVAPMAGITDRAYRIILREQHPGLIFSEMLSAKALVMGNDRTRFLCSLAEDEHPIGIQLFGSDPEIMAEAACICAGSGADLIDINMGCPVPKVVRSGHGAALMNNPLQAGRVVDAVVRAVNLPVTVKMRAGWQRGEHTAPALARLVVGHGASAITVHGRTRDQFYRGTADWSVISSVAAAVDVPVIGNGDVFTPDDAARMLAKTGCAGVMIARGMLGNPWLVGNTVRYLTGLDVVQPGIRERLDMLCRHVRLATDLKGERRAGAEMKKHACWYTKGMPGATSFRRTVMKCVSAAELVKVIGEYCVRLEED